ncbi:hypothetical protein OQE43_16975 [Bacillus velezensis]|uniref:hypothetical protein n=1 Tax=Bacillus velezensis TaxID=492670 RepID=UPI00224ADB73|nr:hypothetical protein [Bacillus velezensis]MCX2885991.1 hypothetical protein [Bacillus velezensis]
MNVLKDFFFLGRPINTEVGAIDFIHLRDYPEYISELNMMKMSKKEIIRNFSKINNDGSLNDLIIELKKNSLFKIVHDYLPEFNQAYFKVFSKVFVDKESLHLIDQRAFNNVRKLILEMHCLTEEKIVDNDELQEFHDLNNQLKLQNSQNDLKDIASCVAAFNGYTYQEVANMTIYQLYLSYYRMGEIMNYNTSALFATVSTDVKIGDWNSHVDMYREEKHHLSTADAKNLEQLFGD